MLQVGRYESGDQVQGEPEDPRVPGGLARVGVTRRVQRDVLGVGDPREGGGRPLGSGSRASPGSRHAGAHGPPLQLGQNRPRRPPRLQPGRHGELGPLQLQVSRRGNINSNCRCPSLRSEGTSKMQAGFQSVGPPDRVLVPDNLLLGPLIFVCVVDFENIFI